MLIFSCFKQAKLHKNVRLNVTVGEVTNATKDEKSFVLVNGNPFNWCINCTYNQLSPICSKDCYFEVCLTLIYNQKADTKGEIVGLTIMDGNFCSLFPYVLNPEDMTSGARRYTLTHVKHTPLMSSKSFTEAEAFMKEVTEETVRQKIPLFEEGISKFYPSFKTEFEFIDWFVSMKTKPLDRSAANHTASRECIAERVGNTIRILSGKINTLFEAERAVLSELLREWSSQIPDSHT